VKRTNCEVPHYVVFSKSHVTSSLLGSNILLSTLFSNTFNSAKENIQNNIAILNQPLIETFREPLQVPANFKEFEIRKK
jgi:hypothetical protein